MHREGYAAYYLIKHVNKLLYFVCSIGNCRQRFRHMFSELRATKQLGAEMNKLLESCSVSVIKVAFKISQCQDAEDQCSCQPLNALSAALTASVSR